MERKYPKFKAAAVQAAPVYLDLDATVEKACGFIDEAASNGAKLVAFPEGFIPGYPWWIWMGDPCVYGQKYYEKLYKNAIEIPGPAMARLADAAKRNEVYVCVSGTERDGGSLYLAQLWFDPRGNFMGKHRKLKPSSSERIVWGEGDGSMMPVFDTEIGRLGGLMCWEHIVPLNVAAMNSLNEQVHVSSWPSFLPDENALMAAIPCETLARYYAIATQTFCIMVSQIYTQEMMDTIAENDFQRSFMQVGSGHTRIFGPNGLSIGDELAPDEEGIAYADLDLEQLIGCKYLADPAGQYSNPGVLSLNFNQGPLPVTRKVGKPEDMSISFEDLQAASH